VRARGAESQTDHGRRFLDAEVLVEDQVQQVALAGREMVQRAE
jgi:hypothetical protein